MMTDWKEQLSPLTLCVFLACKVNLYFSCLVIWDSELNLFNIAMITLWFELSNNAVSERFLNLFLLCAEKMCKLWHCFFISSHNLSIDRNESVEHYYTLFFCFCCTKQDDSGIVVFDCADYLYVFYTSFLFFLDPFFTSQCVDSSDSFTSLLEDLRGSDRNFENQSRLFRFTSFLASKYGRLYTRETSVLAGYQLSGWR